jgi:hypothetical protein
LPQLLALECVLLIRAPLRDEVVEVLRTGV